MYRSLDLSYAEQRPDHSRYAYNISASYFTPAPSDIELDKAIANFAALGLNGVAGMSGPMGQYTNSNYLEDPYRDDGRVNEPLYPGVYAGSGYGQGSIVPPKAIDYPRSMINAPSRIDGSRVSSSRHHHGHSSRKSRHGGSSTTSSRYYQPVDETNSKAMVKYATSKASKSKSKSKHWDDEMSVVPEDSISQVSTRLSSRHGGDEMYEPRGRTRRRDGSVTVRGGMGSVGGVGGGKGFVEPDVYYTREVTPW
ncbi:hypothetical protein PRZ48_001015 [Zasmidium cellare]|uniref:Uncharacterized protein n=1 Tax=Zasmidium cellare TaxID=395010 RepID=A0ABR0F1J0_ZASCE|nr:hypothetical protein PRZ48_001015 [Zasmidium cellare]